MGNPAKPIQDRSLPVNAWWYGTRGENEAIDQAALQQALDVAALTNRACYIPRGTYRVTDTLLVGANVHVFGDGINATILQGKAGAYAGKTVNGTTLLATIGAVASDSVSVTDLSVDHFTNSTEANGIAFVPDLNFAGQPCTNFVVERCSVSGFVAHEYLIWSMNGEHGKILNNFIDGNCTVFGPGPALDQIGIAVLGGSDVLVDGNTVRRCENWGIGVYSVVIVSPNGGDHITVTNNLCDANRIGINISTALDVVGGAYNMFDIAANGNQVRDSIEMGVLVFTPIPGTIMRDVAVRDNEISGGPIAIHIYGFAADTAHRNVTATGNQCYGQTGVILGAVTVTDFNGAAVNGNQITESAGVGVRITGASDVSMCWNQVRRTVGRGLDADSVVRLAANDNRFIDCALSGATYGAAIVGTDCTALRNVCSQAGPFSLMIMVGDRCWLADNTPLVSGAATPWQYIGTNANASFAAPAAPGAGAAFIDIANTLATNAANLGAQIRVVQTAGAPNPVTVTRVATGFRLTFQVVAVGNETYGWEIRQ